LLFACEGVGVVFGGGFVFGKKGVEFTKNVEEKVDGDIREVQSG